MRHILTSLILVILLLPSFALGETFGELVRRDGLYYKKFTEVPFTGTMTGRLQGKFKNGKKEGPWVNYYDNGQLSGKGTWKNGKREGPWVVNWRNGELWYKGTYKDGKRDGHWVSYHDNGQVWKKGTYKDGKEEGHWVVYWKNGELRTKETYRNAERLLGVKVK